MAERVPIWYDVHGGRSSSAGICRPLQKTAAKLHGELNLSLAIAVAEEGEEISCVAGSGPAAPPIGTKLSLEQGICAACVRQNRLQLSNDTADDPMLSAELCGRLGMRSILAVPLRRDSTCVGFVAAFSDVAHRFDVSLIERIRNEATRIEGLLAENATPAVNASPRISKDFDFQFGREAPNPECRIVRTRPPSVTAAFPAYSRPPSIAILACSVVAMVAVAPRVVRSKTSIAHHEVAEMSKPAAHVLQNQAAPFIDSTNSKDSKLRDLHQRANAGDVAAQISLAAAYEKSDGLERDALKACVWYIIAGANGNLAAKDRAVQLSHRLPQFQIAEIRFNIGKMYMQGTGVRRDLVEAYSWFVLAQAAGDVRARDEQEKLEALMSREQVSDGLRRASDWLLAHQSAGGQHARELAAIPRSPRSVMEKSR